MKQSILRFFICLFLLLQQLKTIHCYKDCRDLDFDEATVSTTYNSISDFIRTSDGKSCKIELADKLPVLSSGILNTKPKAYYIRRIELPNNGIEIVERDPFIESGTCIVILNLSNNKIGTLMPGAFEKLKLLQKLDLSNNQLTSLNNSAFAAENILDVLYLQNNQIIHLNGLSNFKNLTALDLSFNKLQLQPGMFKNFSKLLELRLDGNNISFLPLGLFEGISNLENLYLGNNQLREFQTGTFSSVNNLKILNMSYNSIALLELVNEKVFFPISKLHTLILDGNTELINLNASDLNNVFRRLLYLGVSKMPWSCAKLLQFFKDCQRHYIDITKHVDTNFRDHNIHGVRCTDIQNDTIGVGGKTTTAPETPAVVNTGTSLQAASTVEEDRLKEVKTLQVVCVMLAICISLLIGFILLRDRIISYKRRVFNNRCVSNYKNERHNFNTEEPECNLDLITEMNH